MSTFVLVVIGVGACIGVVTSLLLQPEEPATSTAPLIRAPRQARAGTGERGPAPLVARTGVALVDDDETDDEAWAPTAATVSSPHLVATPAGDRSRRAGPPRPPEGEPYAPTPRWQRLVAAIELSAIAVALGILGAAAVGLAVVALFGLLRGAVG